MDLLIRDVPAYILELLRTRARERGRSVQTEALEALRQGVEPGGGIVAQWLRTAAEPAIDVEGGLIALRATRDAR